MKIVGLTGGIGSGKTTVAQMFSAFGVPVYNSDEEAKKLMDSSQTIRESLIGIFGENTYRNGILDRKFLAEKIFADKELLQKVNAIVHPKVAEHFRSWALSQTAPYVIKEAAILFESGANKQCDVVILVTSPIKERIRRVMQRDQVLQQEVEARMKNQWTDAQKRELADFVIDNTSLSHTREQVKKIHLSLI